MKIDKENDVRTEKKQRREENEVQHDEAGWYLRRHFSLFGNKASYVDKNWDASHLLEKGNTS